ncbi:PAS/PAC sensor signal transduction histidine kinase [Halorhabdus utahensis DSM 12940]|uniref:histidine kinase n=1 Tax=Halorhabdus utahensis (strain DSM 12940 / JCM 11049 / AX-2) TaxID=519442 RepID=C7NSF1_HALUD|nr:PAS domain-containing sensor histidine kinase [Halorhabdus utahensis]ACV12038.1 PAS/PAC sensor signal transduction histidine kinase [Halorhabdus utahensis DSM 12940]
MNSARTDDENRVVPDDPDLLLQLTEYTDDSLWMFSPDWKEVIFANSRYEDIFGEPLSTLEDDPRSFLEAVHPDDRDSVVAAMEELSGGEPADLEFRVDPADNYETWVWVQAQPVYDDSGEIAALAGYTRDITRRKEYQRELEHHREALEKSNESLREFAYIASHDLQEPLRMVSSYVDLLEREYGDQFDDEAEEYMEFAVNGAKRMKRMINSLLEYSRVHTQAEEFDEVDAAEVFESARQDLELLIADHSAEITVGDLPTASADRDQLGQVFQNLLKNSIEHAGEDGTPQIDVTVTDRPEAYEFAVADNGPGIPADEQDDVFDIFRQGANAEAGNTGIGLAITRRIVQRHGGEIWIESEPGEGAAFKFTIPKGLNVAESEGVDHE